MSPRYIPEGYAKHVEVGEAIVYYRDMGGCVYAMGWQSHNQVKTSFRYRFKDEDQRQRWVDEWLRQQAAKAVTKAARKEDRRVAADRPNPFTVGDVLHYSWGYDQTNAEFYEIVEVKPRSVVIRRIASKVVEGTQGFMCENRVPVPGSFVENKEPMLKRINVGYMDKPSLTMGYGLATIWNGSPVYSSWYA